MKKWLVSLIAGLLLTLGVASPASALTQDRAEYLAKRFGCTAQVVLIDSFQNAAYISYDPFLRIQHTIILGFGDIQDDERIGVLLHEVAHCLNQQQGVTFKTQKDEEWNADEFAIQGLRELRLNEEALLNLFIRHLSQIKEGGVHGMLRDRMLNMKASLRKVQA